MSHAYYSVHVAKYKCYQKEARSGEFPGGNNLKAPEIALIQRKLQFCIR